MSEPSHNDFERDATLTAIYRVSARDVPPGALDAAILAAARREVGARPRPAGFSFAHSWRAPLSIAAVIVLSVSLVTLMREEAPELTAPPLADAPAAQARRASPANAEDGAPPDDRGFVRDPQQSRNIGLKPPQPALPAGLGMRPPEFNERGSQPAQDAKGVRAEADAASAATCREAQGRHCN